MGVQTARAGGSQLAARALVAGIIGGVLIDLFLIVFRFAPFPGIWQFVASGLVGKIAFTSGSYIVLGLFLHFLISIVWAEIYAYAASAAHALHKWLVSGLIFGVVVMVAMQLIEVAKGLAPAPNAAAIAIGLIAHVVFFGWPIAWYLRNGQPA
ncbi:MAG: hypothetical protein ACXWNK_03795 [Vulcanimicrobiaceae bacterium]